MGVGVGEEVNAAGAVGVVFFVVPEFLEGTGFFFSAASSWFEATVLTKSILKRTKN